MIFAGSLFLRATDEPSPKAYSGAPLTKSLGDDLVRSGVNLCPLFGL